MSRAQKIILLVLTLVIAATRLLAVARSLFDWDEALFALGVRDYDVPQHHPHPPGYPLFVAAAKAVHLLGVSEFRSLQVVVVLGAIFLFPALFFLAREIGFDFTTSASGAAIFTFLPNVWIYSGTGFSDVPATTVGLAACALLLRGRHDTRAYILGAIVLGIAAGIRPPNLLLGAVPAIIATVHRARVSIRPVILAIVLGASIVTASYAGAALASVSKEAYVGAVRHQSKYVREVDSYHNPHRPPLRHVAKMFFLWPVQHRQQMIGLAVLALVSLGAALVKRRKEPLLTIAIFGPFAIMAWLHLDIEAAGRYAVAYMSAHALLAADGLGVLALRRPRAQAVLCAMVVIVFGVWTWPAVWLQRTTFPPPLAALDWLQRNVPSYEMVYVHAGIGPQADAVLPRTRRVTFYERYEEIPMISDNVWFVDLRVVPGAHNFVWSHGHPTWKILRRRNFESAVGTTATLMIHGAGWHDAEGTFRWMAGQSATMLPAFAGNGRLSLRAHVPIDALNTTPTVTVSMNGVMIERFPAPGRIEKSWVVPSRRDALNELRITTTHTANPARSGFSNDDRDLGLRVDALTWSPVR